MDRISRYSRISYYQAFSNLAHNSVTYLKFLCSTSNYFFSEHSTVQRTKHWSWIRMAQYWLQWKFVNTLYIFHHCYWRSHAQFRLQILSKVLSNVRKGKKQYSLTPFTIVGAWLTSFINVSQNCIKSNCSSASPHLILWFIC